MYILCACVCVCVYDECHFMQVYIYYEKDSFKYSNFMILCNPELQNFDLQTFDCNITLLETLRF